MEEPYPYDTVASNPGRVTVDHLCHFMNYPKWYLIWGVPSILFVGAATQLHWACWIPAVICIVLLLLYTFIITETFKHGCVNPGIVVQVSPTLIAVMTDLSKGDGEHYPVMKIIKKNLPRVKGEELHVGTRVATVAIYQDDAKVKRPHWVDFHPKPVLCANFDPTVAKRILNTIDTDDWEHLERELSAMHPPYTPGLRWLKSDGPSIPA